MKKSKTVFLIPLILSRLAFPNLLLTLPLNSRHRKLPADKLITFLVSQGASSTKNELLDFFDLDTSAPTASAFNQQRAKLKADALEAVFGHFNHFAVFYDEDMPSYRFLAADGSDFTFFSRPSFASPDYYVSEGHSAKGFYNMHLNAFYDLQTHTYTDALIQAVHDKDEFRAFCLMVDRYQPLPKQNLLKKNEGLIRVPNHHALFPHPVKSNNGEDKFNGINSLIGLAEQCMV